MTNFTDIEIIESIKRGNSNDFSLLIDRYKDRAFTLLKRMLKNEMDAEEALQDAFLKTYSALTRFQGNSKFSTWFYKIVYNTALTILGSKKRKIIQEMESLDNIFNLENEDDKIYATSESAREYLLKVVDKLPPRNSVIIILFYIDGLSMNEIAGVMDISLVNTKVLLHRSRNALRDLLIKHNYQEEILWNT